MGTRYAGRHRVAARASESSTPARGRHSSGSRRIPAKVVRRPLLSAGAALALVGASAAGYAKAGDTASSSAATFTVPEAAVAQARERSTEQLERTAYRAQATALLSLRRSAAAAATQAQQAAAAAAATQAQQAAAAARTQAQQAAAAARTQAQQAADAAAATQAEREAAQAQASRDAQRQAVVDQAQQDPRSVARMMLDDFGWSDSQWSCLERLWVGESGWDYRATNRSSGSYGIPQALPASKMGTVAADYLTNPVTQITWGMQYIQSSYGTPCGALRTWSSRSPHWY